VVGALACVRGNRRARGLAPLTPSQARQRLRTTGSPQQDAPGRPRTQRIGNRPNLRQLIGPIKIKEVKEGKAEIKEIKEIKEGKEGKAEAKELKEKEFKEFKEKEFKELKPEIEKNIDKGPKETLEGPSQVGADPAHALGLLAQRIDDLERRLSGGQAFIQQGERPDIGTEAFDETPEQTDGP
jgi:hypothetical protein